MANRPQVSIEDAAHVLRVSKPTVYKLIEDGKLDRPLTIGSLRKHLKRRAKEEKEETDRCFERLDKLEAGLNRSG